MAVVVAPPVRRGCLGGRRQFDDDVALTAVGDPGCRRRRGSALGEAGLPARWVIRPQRHRSESAQAGSDGPAGFGLPPVVDNGNAQHPRWPIQVSGRGAHLPRTACIDETSYLASSLASGRPCGMARMAVGGEQRADLVVGDDPPNAPAPGCRRFSLVHDGGGAHQQRRVHDVAVPDDLSSTSEAAQKTSPALMLCHIGHRPGTWRRRDRCQCDHAPVCRWCPTCTARTGGQASRSPHRRVQRRWSRRPVEPAVVNGGRTGDLLTVFHDDRRVRRKLRQFRALATIGRPDGCGLRFDAAGCGDQGTGWASPMRVASLGAAKPPKTTEWTSPDPRARGIAMAASGSSACIMMTAVTPDTQRGEDPGEPGYLVEQSGIAVGADLPTIAGSVRRRGPVATFPGVDAGMARAGTVL